MTGRSGAEGADRFEGAEGADRAQRADAGRLFRGVDLALFAATFTHRLRQAGIAVGPTATNRLALALSRCRPTDLDSLYWTCRVTMVGDRRDLDAFDRVFAAVFDGGGLPILPGQRSGPAPGRAVVRTEGSVVRRSVPIDGLAALSARITSPRPEVVDDGADEVDESGSDPGAEHSVVADLLPADLAELADRPFDQLDDEQLDRIGRWLSTAVVDLPHRQTRRRQPSHRGAIDLRRSLAAARSTGEVMTLARRRRATEPRGLVMVADVSGSMESFTRLHLHLLRAFAQRPEVRGFEAFVFSTDLHRVTVALRTRDHGTAVDHLSNEAADRFGGTRIATNLGRLLSSPRWSHTVRGATVVVVSDGWDADDPALLGRRMARLARMAHRVVWINPRAGDQEWQPTVGGMAAALPHVDRLCSGHSLRAMGEVIRAIAAR